MRKVPIRPYRPGPAEKGDIYFGVHHPKRVDRGCEAVLRGQDQITSRAAQEQRVGERGVYV